MRITRIAVSTADSSTSVSMGMKSSTACLLPLSPRPHFELPAVSTLVASGWDRDTSAKCAQNLRTATENRRYSAQHKSPRTDAANVRRGSTQEGSAPMQYNHLTALVSVIGLIVVASDIAEWVILGGL